MNRLSVMISVGLFSAVQAMSQGVSLGLASGSGSPGSTVSIDLNLTDPDTDQPASLEWTLNYSTADFSSATFSTGAAGSGASKSLLCSSGTGSVTCVLSGQNSAGIASGTIATLSLVVANSTSDASSALQLINSDASDPAGSSLVVSATGGTVTISPPALNGFSCSPVSITPPAKATCNIALTGSAPVGGASITMSASPADISFPTVVIPAGSTSTTFSISSSTVATSTPVTLTASYASVNSTFPITVLPQAGTLASVTAPASVNSGQTGSGTVTLTAAAPSGGAVVSLSSSNPSAAQVPSSVTIAAGNTSATFTITAGVVSAATTVTFTASYSGATATATTTISPSTLPVINSATTATATVGTSFSYQITASNSPTSYNATGLPAGLSVNTASGLISGTPTAAGSSTITLSATNNTGTGTAKLSLTINPAAQSAPVITSPTTATGSAGAAFSYQITASNYPTSYSATGLPAGLSVNASSGLISGTAATAGTSIVTLGAANSSGTGHATLTLTIGTSSAAISFVQATAKANTSDSKTLAVSFSKNTVAGDLIMVGFDFDASVTASITDSQGNTFTQAGKQLISAGGTRTQVYYAQNIKGGAERVTVTLSARASVIECYLAEYSGVSQTNPIDAQAGASGTASTISSGSVTTTVAGDLIYGYSVCDSSCTVGSGFTARSTLDANLVEDKLAGAPGSYAATGTANSGWTMQLVALKP